jgi:plastocyanin
MWRRTVSIGLAAGAISAMSVLAVATPSDASGGGKKVKMEDDCQPASFNAAIGPGTCIGDGRTTVDSFFAELAATKKAAAWHYDPSMLTVRGGRAVILENEGGETHTFTMVRDFGGGFVAPLNALSGNPMPAGECATTLPDGSLAPKPPSAVNVFVAADREAAFKTAGLKPGKYRFQCCIHPWMRIVLTVR